MSTVRIAGAIILLLGAALGFFVYTSERADARFPFRFGLDLAGGSHLVYTADTAAVPESEVRDAMQSLREVVERRVNIFGVSEPIVQTEQTFGGEHRLVVELPGVTDLEQAAELIGKTPALEFRLQETDATGNIFFTETGLSGRFVQRAQLNFENAGTGMTEPVVTLFFNSEGANLFFDITNENTGEILAIFLDDMPISLPVIQQAIPGGTAVISGNFTPEEARALVRDLNFGALPVPIALVSSSSIGPALGAETLAAGIVAGLAGLALVALFMVVWYRVPGVVAVCALIIYGLIILALFKLLPVTLTAAGIAAFILSIGMAVDANILIFERMKEELAAGNTLDDAIRQGFARAWPSIRDSNLSSLISAAVLFWFGTALIKGFALVFALGVIASMLSAIIISRTLLLSLAFSFTRNRAKLLYGSGIKM
jgi:preprotein translocase subunit SecD